MAKKTELESMVEKIKHKPIRIRVGLSLDKDVYEKFCRLAERSEVPSSRLIEELMIKLLNEVESDKK